MTLNYIVMIRFIRFTVPVASTALLAAILLSCEKNDCSTPAGQLTGSALKLLDDRYIALDNGEDLGRFGVRVATQSDYTRLFKNCCAAKPDTIDFTKYDLLGLSTVNHGSSSTYTHDVKRDDAAKKIVYTVTENYCSKASPVDGRGNFVLVQKIPDSYQIEFVRNQ